MLKITKVSLNSTGSKESLEQSLINDLLKGYNKDAHPIPEQNKSLYMVTFGLELVQLVNVVSIMILAFSVESQLTFVFLFSLENFNVVLTTE